MGRAESLLYPRGPVKVDRSKMPTADEVREAARRNANHLLGSFLRRYQSQIGFPKTPAGLGNDRCVDLPDF